MHALDINVVENVITPIERKIYALLGDDPFYEISDSGCQYFTMTNGEWSYEVDDGTITRIYIES